jgi:hypothetical protein
LETVPGYVIYYLKEHGVEAMLAPPHRAASKRLGVARAAYGKAVDGQTVSASELTAAYLRLPQAERERLKARGENP